MKNKKIFSGIISGLFASSAGIILISVFLSKSSLEESFIHLYYQKKLGGLISLGSLINLPIFLIAIKKEKYDFALGLLVISLFFVALIAFLKIY